MAKIAKIEYAGLKQVYDLGIKQWHNYIASGILSHNCMKVSQVLSGFDPIQANKLRSVISKKKKDQIPKMKDKFINGAQKRIDAGEITKEEVVAMWDLIESFASYAFCKSLDDRTKIPYKNKYGKKSTKQLKNFKKGDIVYCWDLENKKLVETDVVELHDHGKLEGIEITFDDGSKEVCSINHKFLTNKGMIPLHQILKENLDILSYA